MLTVAEVKQYLRIDYDTDDLMLAGYIRSANNYMRSSIDDYEAKLEASATGPDTWGEAARNVEKMLIADWYEHRVAVEKDPKKVTAVELVIQQLQLVPPEGYVGV